MKVERRPVASWPRLPLVAAFFLALAAGGWTSCKPTPHAEIQQPPALETIEASGEILGLAIGSPMQDARAKLDPLRVPAVYTPDLKETSGRRIYWKLKETEFDWIMAWGNAEGKITRLRAVYRADQKKPFREIGSLERAASVTAQTAKWNLRRPGGPHFRLIAQGAEQQAQTVYMFALELAGEPARTTAPEAEDED